MKHRGKRGRMLELVASSRGLTLHEFREKIGREQQRRDDLLKRLGIDKASLDAALAGSHGQELAKCRALIEGIGGVCNVTAQAQRLQGTPGFPDLYVHLIGWDWWSQITLAKGLALHHLKRSNAKSVYAFWWEVKVGRDKLSPEQVAFIGRETAAGHYVGVGDCNDLQRYLQRIGVLR